MELSIRKENAMLLDGQVGSSDKRRLRAQIYLALAVGDTLSIIGGFLLASFLRFGVPDRPQALTVMAATLPLFWAFSVRSYRPTILVNWRRGVGPALLSLLGAVVAVLFLGFMLKAAEELSRLLLSSALLFSSVVLIGSRALVGAWSRKRLNGVPMSNILLVDGARFHAPPGTEIVHADQAGLSSELGLPFTLDRLARIVSGADNVFVACLPERRRAWAMALKGCNIHAELLAPELDTVGVVGNSHFGDTATLLVSTGPLALRDQFAKRALDILIALPSILFLAPLLCIVAIAIKIDSAGPVLFRQQRVGLNNRLFDVLKFRSMRVDQCDGAGSRSTARDDHRITRVGRLIRATSIDELPQLFNILKGQMSFVGPRPHALGSLAGDQLFWEVDQRYFHRHACKPGLTGLAQVRGFRGATHRRKDLVDRLQADLEYMNGWTVWRDLAIMLRTVKVVVHRNAY